MGCSVVMSKILLAEDDTDMRRFLVKALQNAGFDVTSYDNGLSAYHRLREEPFELLLTDIVMPGEENGLELSQRLLAQKPALKVIYTSGYSSDLFSSEIDLKDGLNYLPKPYLSSKLTNILRSALAHPGEGESMDPDVHAAG